MSRVYSRGRDGDCAPPPAQTPACVANAPGSHLGYHHRTRIAWAVGSADPRARRHRRHDTSPMASTRRREPPGPAHHDAAAAALGRLSRSSNVVSARASHHTNGYLGPVPADTGPGCATDASAQPEDQALRRVWDRAVHAFVEAQPKYCRMKTAGGTEEETRTSNVHRTRISTNASSYAHTIWAAKRVPGNERKTERNERKPKARATEHKRWPRQAPPRPPQAPALAMNAAASPEPAKTNAPTRRTTDGPQRERRRNSQPIPQDIQPDQQNPKPHAHPHRSAPSLDPEGAGVAPVRPDKWRVGAP